MRFFVTAVIILIISGCSLFPPKPPEPKGKLVPINQTMEKMATSQYQEPKIVNEK